MVVEQGHLTEIHAEDAGNQRGRHEQGGEHGEDANFGIEAVADAGKVDVEEVGQQIAHRLQGFEHVDGVVVDVAQIEAGVRREEAVVGPGQAVEYFAQGPQGPAQESGPRA
jgi:hypothetical protein